MQPAQVVGVVHLLILAALSWYASGRLAAGRLRRLCIVSLLIWCNLVYTALFIAAFSQLGSIAWYFWVSILSAGGLAWLLRRRKLIPQTLPDEREPDSSGVLDRWVRRFLLTTVAAAAIASAIICYKYVPNNADTLSYRFSRAFFYIGHGNLLHYAPGVDIRQLIYPLNGALAYIFIAKYQFADRWMYAVTYLAWVFSGIGVYLLSRSVGASRTAGIVAAWACWMAPNILAQAASTNDEILSAAPIVLGIAFGVDWWKSGSKRFLFLAAIGMGLGCGTKLHWAFYWPFVAVLAIFAGVHFIRHPEFRTTLAGRLPAIGAAALVALPLAGSFAVCNYLSIGKLTDMEWNRRVMNRPFRLEVAEQGLRIFTGQLLLSFIPDLVPPVHPEKRAVAYRKFNQVVHDALYSDIPKSAVLGVDGSVFEGIADVNGFRYHEYTVWLGFLPWLLLIALIGSFAWRACPLSARLLLGSFFLWHISYSVQTGYGTLRCVYYSVPAVLAAAGLSVWWDYGRSLRKRAAAGMIALFLVLFVTHVVLGANLLAFGDARNLRAVWKKDFAPDANPVSPTIVDAIRNSSRIYIPGTHWEVLYWSFMRFHPGARYETGPSLQPDVPGRLMLINVDPEAGWRAARLPESAGVPGLTYLGYGASNPVFAKGDRIETRYPERSRYILARFTLRRELATNALTSVQMDPYVMGADRNGGIEFRYELRSTRTNARLEHRWMLLDGRPDGGLLPPAEALYDTLVLETRLAKKPEQVMRTIQQLDLGFRVGGNEEAYIGTPPEVPIVTSKRADGGDVIKVSLSLKGRTLSVQLAPIPKEMSKYQGQLYEVRWLGKETEFSIENAGPRTEAVIGMRLGIFAAPHTAMLVVNGKPVTQEWSIRRSFTIFPEPIQFKVRLEKGTNRILLVSKEPPDILPVDRPVSFLLVGDVECAESVR